MLFDDQFPEISESNFKLAVFSSKHVEHFLLKETTDAFDEPTTDILRVRRTPHCATPRSTILSQVDKFTITR